MCRRRRRGRAPNRQRYEHILRPLYRSICVSETLAWLGGVSLVMVAAMWTGRVLSRLEGACSPRPNSSAGFSVCSGGSADRSSDRTPRRHPSRYRPPSPFPPRLQSVGGFENADLARRPSSDFRRENRSRGNSCDHRTRVVSLSDGRRTPCTVRCDYARLGGPLRREFYAPCDGRRDSLGVRANGRRRLQGQYPPSEPLTSPREAIGKFRLLGGFGASSPDRPK